MLRFMSRSCAAKIPLVPRELSAHPAIRLMASYGSDEKTAVPSEIPTSFLGKYFGPHTAFAAPDFPSSKRWKMALPAFATHVCIGTPWAWSIMALPLMTQFGGVAPAAADWSMAQVSAPMPIVFALMGISAAAAGKWQLKVGVRQAMLSASVCFGGGMMLGGLGVHLHSLPLIYAGYGILSGTGIGMAYTPPVATLIEWFPNKRGMASGLCIAGFGSGALVFTGLASALMAALRTLPTFVGPLGSVPVTNKDGRMFADIGGNLTEVVNATSSDLAKFSGEVLQEGLYIVGTGNTGAAATLGILGAAALMTMALSGYKIRRPAPGWLPAGYTPPVKSASGAPAMVDVPTALAIKTPQFMLLITSFFCLATGGMAMFSVAKSMMIEVFAGVQPSLAAFSSVYVSVLAIGNLSGRLGWSSLSDKIGRRKTFQLFTLGSIPLYLSVPWLVNQAVVSPSILPGVAFVGATAVAVSLMGGAYSTLPAYESDLFGPKYVGGTHGFMLLGSSAAALFGPWMILNLRGFAQTSAITDLLTKVDPARFEQTFLSPISQAQELIEAKTLTLAKLVTILPPGVPDPSPFLYNNMMYGMVGMMSIAALTHHMVRPLSAGSAALAGSTSAKLK